MEKTNKTLKIDFNGGHVGFNFIPNKSTLLTNKHKYTNISLNISRLFYLNNMVNLA
jgi:hypothetical protein